MDRNIVRAYFWQEIINLGFNPSGNDDQKSWVHQYAQSLKEFWEIDAYPIKWFWLCHFFPSNRERINYVSIYEGGFRFCKKIWPFTDLLFIFSSGLFESSPTYRAELPYD